MLSVCAIRECCTLLYIQPSWQSCTGDGAPRIVNMHGIRVVYMYEEGGWSVKLVLNFSKAATITNVIKS